MDIKSAILIGLIVTLPWTLLFLFMLVSNKKTIRNYQKLHRKYGLKTDFTKKDGMKIHPSAFGIYRNKDIKIETTKRESLNGKRVLPHTELLVECLNKDNFSFTVIKRKKQNTAIFADSSALLDDKDFDSKFIVKTNDPERIKRIFDFNTRFKLDQVHRLGFDGAITLSGNALEYIEKDLLDDEESLMRMELVLHEFCDIAEVMRHN
jgi:hypothetical protein